VAKAQQHKSRPTYQLSAAWMSTSSEVAQTSMLWLFLLRTWFLEEKNERSKKRKSYLLATYWKKRTWTLEHS